MRPGEGPRLAGLEVPERFAYNELVYGPQPIPAGKLARLAAGLPLRVLDLFSGCGGLSLGFQRAGFEIMGGLEKDHQAAQVCARNLHCGTPEERQRKLARSRDICAWSPTSLLRDLDYEDPDSVDVLIGGPPCQAYARVGRAKLREIAAHPEAFRQDDRGRLYLEYLRYVRELRPLALLLENVPDILSYGGCNVAREIATHLTELGYLVNIGLLNAAHYGVPQHRRRIYLVALHRDLGLAPSLPAPTHRTARLPSGYREFTALVKALPRNGKPFSGPVLKISSALAENLPEAVTVQQAIGDLPRLTAHLCNSPTKSRRYVEPIPYETQALSDFSREMREGWPDFEGGKTVEDQITRRLPRDFPIFARMRPEDDYPKACRIASSLFEEALAEERQQGRELEPESLDWLALRSRIVPPYDPTKFPNKWWKMNPDAPARTLLAHLAHDSYTHIHYDDAQARTLTVREAARLQSFPDGFRFAEAMNPSFRLIGNAVPPLVAFRFATHLSREMQKAVRTGQIYEIAS